MQSEVWVTASTGLPGGPAWWAAAGAVVVGAAVIKGLSTGGNRHEDRRRDRYRDTSSAWATPADVRKLITPDPDRSRVVLGILGRHTIANPPRRSVLVQAPTGAGKTPRIVVPTVLRHEGPALVASVKSDVLRLTRRARAEKGPVWVFDPTGATSEVIARWSPLASIVTYADAMKSAAWMTDSSKVGGRDLEDQRFWDSMGRMLLAPMLFAAARTGRHIADVVRWVLYQAEDEVQEVLDELGDADALAAWAASRARHEKTKSSVWGTAQVVVEAFGHPEVRDALAARPGDPDVFDIHALLDTGGTLYLVAPASDQRLFTPVFETLTNAVLREVERRAAKTGLPLDPPLLLMLDEAANIAPLRHLDEVASKGANEGTLTVSVWQDEGQIISIYGRDRARTVLSNHVARVYLPGVSDEETLRNLSEAIGDHQVRKMSQSRDQHGRITKSTQLVDERVAPPQWLRRLREGTAIVLTGSTKPMRLRVPGWFEDPELRSQIDPEVAAAFDAQFAPSSQARSRVPRRERAGQR